jgi:hypothetical protein
MKLDISLKGLDREVGSKFAIQTSAHQQGELSKKA